MSDFQDNAPVQLKPIKACAQIIADRDRYREALENIAAQPEDCLRNTCQTIARNTLRATS